jgi:hypothetical protein
VDPPPLFFNFFFNSSLLWDVFIINSVEQLQTLPKTQSAEIDISPFLKTQKPSILYSIISVSVSVSVDEFLPINAHLNMRGRLIHHHNNYDEWDRFVAPPRHKFVTGAALLQLTSSHNMITGLPLLWNQREKWLLFQVLTKEKWETTGRSGESTWRSQNISLINCTTFHIRRALSWHSYVIMYLLCIKVYSVVV